MQKMNSESSGEQGDEGSVMEPQDAMEKPHLSEATNLLLKEVDEEYQLQFKENKLSIEGKIKEKLSSIRDTSKKRAILGAQLFDAQQKVAILQTRIQALVEDTPTDEELERIDTLIKEEDEALRCSKADLEETMKLYFNTQEEANEANETITREKHRIDELMKAQKIAAQRAHSNIQNIKSIEDRQVYRDISIMHLEEELVNMRDREELLDAQLELQSKAGSSTAVSIRDALNELKHLKASNEKSLQECNRCICCINQRETTLEKQNEALQKQSDDEQQTEVEIKSFYEKTKDEGYEKTNLELEKNRIKKFSNIIACKMQESIDLTEKKRSEEIDLKKQIDASNEQICSTEISKKHIQQLINIESKKVEEAASKVTEASKKCDELNRDRVNSDRRATVLTEMHKKMISKLQERELLIELLRNELAQIRFDTLDVRMGQTVLRNKLSALKVTYNVEKDAIKTLEAQIEQQYFIIQKKQLQVDSLSNLVEEKSKWVEGGKSFELERIISNLRKEYADMVTKNKEMEKRWLTLQTKLLASKSKHGECEKQLSTKKAELLILQQQLHRLDKIAEQLTTDKCNLSKTISRRQYDFGRLNTALADHRVAIKKLEEGITNLKETTKSKAKENQELIDSLMKMLQTTKQKMEEDCQVLSAVEKQKDELDHHLSTHVQQITSDDMMHKKKLLNDKLFQLKRSKLESTKLDKYQAILLKEMKKAVKNTNQIAAQYSDSKEANKQSDAIKLIDLNRKVDALKKHIKGCQKEMNETTNEINDVSNQLMEAKGTIEAELLTIKQYQDSINSKDLLNIRQKLQIDQMLGSSLILQKSAVLYEECANNRLRRSNPSKLSEGIEAEVKDLQLVYNLMDEFRVEHEDLHPIFEAFQSWVHSTQCGEAGTTIHANLINRLPIHTEDTSSTHIEDTANG